MGNKKKEKVKIKMEHTARTVVCELIVDVAEKCGFGFAEDVYDTAESILADDSQKAIDYLKQIALLTHCDESLECLNQLSHESEKAKGIFFEWFIELGEFAFYDIFVEEFLDSMNQSIKK